MNRLVAIIALRLRDEPCNLALAFEDALPLDFRRMRGKDGRHVRAREPAHEGIEADVAHFVERVRQASRPARRARRGVRAPAPVLLLVLGDVEEMREEAERAHHVHRLVEIERVEQPIELGAVGVLAPEGDCRLPDALDALERLLSRLAADHLAEQPPKQAAVLAQQVLLIVAGHRNGGH